MLRLAAPAVRVRLAGSAGVVRCRMLLLLLRPRWSLPGEPVHLRRVGAHHAAGAAKAHGCPQLRMSGGRAPLCAAYTALPATPRRCPRDADPMQPAAYGKARFARRCRPPSFGCWRCPGRPSSTAHARAIAHPATPPPSRPIRAAARVSRRLPLDVGTCTPNGPKPGWLVAASFSRRRCVLCVPRFPRAHVHMQSRLAAPSRGRFATARMSGRVE